MVLSGAVFSFCPWGRSPGLPACLLGMACGLVHGGAVIPGPDTHRASGDMTAQAHVSPVKSLLVIMVPDCTPSYSKSGRELPEQRTQTLGVPAFHTPER